MPHRFSLRQLEYFVAVGDLGSVAQAAERLNVSAPSISASISQLEAEFGVQLFVRRHARGLTPTTIGRSLLAEARDLLAAAERFGALAGDMGDALSGPLHLGCLQTFAPMLLPELRQGFERAFPQVSVRQRAGDHAMLLDQLRKGDLDICLTYDLEMPREVEFEALTELPAYVMLPAGHPLAARAHLTPEDLAGEPMVLLDLPVSADYFLAAMRAAGVAPRIAERSGDMALVRSLVANGYGYSLANIRPRTDLAPDGKPLRYVPMTGGPRPLRLGLASVRAARRSRIVEAFEGHCRQAISAERIPGLTL